MGLSQLLQEGLGKGEEPINRSGTSRRKTVVNACHKNPYMRLSPSMSQLRDASIVSMIGCWPVEGGDDDPFVAKLSTYS